MKARGDFIMSSSSSSYIIAYKASPNFDEEAIRRHPILRGVTTTLRGVLFATNDYDGAAEGEQTGAVEELDRYFVGYYGYEKTDALSRVLDDDHCPKEHYDKCSKPLNGGYNIVFKRVDYNDSTFDSIIRNLVNTDGTVRITAGE